MIIAMTCAQYFAQLVWYDMSVEVVTPIRYTQTHINKV